MKLATRWWGVIDVTYWRDEQGREGLRSAQQLRGNPTGIVLARDLARSGAWDTVIDDAMKESCEVSPRLPIDQEFAVAHGARKQRVPR